MARRGKAVPQGVTGRVVRWDDDESWGVLVSEEISGPVFAHFSQSQMDGYRTLSPGQSVEFGYEPGRGQDGCDHVAAWVRPA
jgi:cold shock protein